jgi:DNA-binding protein H-NS
MAQQTYEQLQKQISVLAAQAESVRQGEVAEVIVKIKDAIHTYGLRVKDLFGKEAAAKPRSKSTSKTTSIKYSNGTGGVWAGRGPRPAWLRQAIAAGKSLENFEVTAGAPSVAATGKTAPAQARKVSKKAAGSKRKDSFADGSGKTWSGMGPKPSWVKDALASGKSLDELRAN